MKSKIVILTLVGLTAGVFGTVGSRMLLDPPATAAVGNAAGAQVRQAAITGPPRDACRGLARRVSRGSMSDAQLKRLIKRHQGCNAVVIDSKAPASGTNSAPRIVTIPATTQAASTQAPPATLSQPPQSYDDDEAEHEEEHGDEGDFEEVEHEEDD